MVGSVSLVTLVPGWGALDLRRAGSRQGHRGGSYDNDASVARAKQVVVATHAPSPSTDSSHQVPVCLVSFFRRYNKKGVPSFAEVAGPTNIPYPINPKAVASVLTPVLYATARVVGERSTCESCYVIRRSQGHQSWAVDIHQPSHISLLHFIGG